MITPPPRPLGARLLRVVVDVVVLTVAYLIGVTVDYVWRVNREPVAGDLEDAWGRYLPALVPLLVIAIACFALSGFYSRQRTYRGRPKAEAVLQACVLAFLAYAALAYALRAYVLFPSAIAIAVTAAITIVVLLVLRLYGQLWKRAAGLLAVAADPERVSTGRAIVNERTEVVVIGGAGYVGSALVPMLLDAGKSVRLLDRFIFGRDPIAAFVGHPSLTIQDADYRRTDQLVLAMRHADSVIHLGGIVGDPACALDERLTIELNLAANRAVAEIAKAQQVRRFVFASSCSVYGANSEVLDENSRLNPVSLYAESKVATEVVISELADHDFRPTILRLGTVYGLSGRIRFDLVVNLLTAKAVMDGVIPVYGPSQWRPFVHVADAASAFALAVMTENRIVEGRTYNVGRDDQNMTLGDLGRLIAEKVPTARLEESETAEDARNYRVSFARIHRELGYRPTWSVRSGVDQIIEALRSGTIADYTDPAYSNVAWLRQLLHLDELGRDDRALLRSLGSNVPSHGSG